MPPTATPHTIVISPGTKLVTIPNPPKVEVDYSSEVATLPKYAVGLFDSNGSGPRKRKRLTHLTPEEKIMRRKLKNRVAAQTARDRKKIRMESLEETVQKIQQQAKELLDVNMKLLVRAETLERENAELRNKLGLGKEENSTVAGNRSTVERIKLDFDHTVGNTPNQCSLPDGILSPDESADENDCPGFKSNNSIPCRRAIRQCRETDECVSPKPAVFGEHGKERLIPQQQEAVKPTLIHSKVAPTPSVTLLTVKKIVPMMTSLDCLNPSAALTMKTSKSILSSQTTALDLTTH